jgi:aspartyl-tRNA(Asn)/glutamyl-tRNA(Gln) amidotransferase subunit A
MPLAWSSDKLGPIAHTAADCAMVLGAIAGYDERDPVSARHSFRGPASRRQLTIGVLQRDLDDAPRATIRAFEDVLHALRGLGHHLVTVALPDVDWSRIFYVILGAETLAAHEDLIRSGRLDGLADAEQARGFRELESQELLPYVRAVQQRVASIRPVRDLFTSVDALVAPTTLTEAPPADADLAQYRGKRRGGNMHMGALIGLPELSLPMGHGDAGLPLGVSLIGDLYSEAVLLRAGIDLQKATDWHLAHPQVAG